MVADLPSNISTFGSLLEISFLNNEFGFLNPGQDKHFLILNGLHNSFDSGDGILFFVKGFCTCLITRMLCFYLILIVEMN